MHFIYFPAFPSFFSSSLVESCPSDATSDLKADEARAAHGVGEAVFFFFFFWGGGGGWGDGEGEVERREGERERGVWVAT